MHATELPRPRSSRRCVRSARPRGQRLPSGAIAWGASSRATRWASTPQWDAATRTRYRQTVAQLARRTGRTEIDIAEDVLARAQSGAGARRHVGWFLLREVLGAPEKRRDGTWYIAAVIVGTLALSLLLGFATGSVSGAVLLLIPVSEVVKGPA